MFQSDQDGVEKLKQSGFGSIPVIKPAGLKNEFKIDSKRSPTTSNAIIIILSVSSTITVLRVQIQLKADFFIAGCSTIIIQVIKNLKMLALLSDIQINLSYICSSCEGF